MCRQKVVAYFISYKTFWSIKNKSDCQKQSMTLNICHYISIWRWNWQRTTNSQLWLSSVFPLMEITTRFRHTVSVYTFNNIYLSRNPIFVSDAQLNWVRASSSWALLARLFQDMLVSFSDVPVNYSSCQPVKTSFRSMLRQWINIQLVSSIFWCFKWTLTLPYKRFVSFYAGPSNCCSFWR